MCNLYSVTKGQQAIRDAYRAMVDRTGNMPSLPGVFPDYSAPIVRSGPEGRELVMARWGMPSPALTLKNHKVDKGVTNVRNVASPHWRRWLGVGSRCLVPFTSFSENEALPDGRHPPVWFALGEDRPMAAFAGIWTNWTSVRKLAEGKVTTDLFAFLTTEPNAEVGAVHPKAMPVILTTPEECETWMTAPAAEALTLQRPLPDDALQIVARGEKQDPPPARARAWSLCPTSPWRPSSGQQSCGAMLSGPLSAPRSAGCSARSWMGASFPPVRAPEPTRHR